MSALQKSLMKKLPPRCPRTDAAKLAPSGWGRMRDYTPLGWEQYFSRAEYVHTASGTFRVFLSHEPAEPTWPRIITLHGGGYSGLSWSLFTEELLSMIHCQVVSIDLRGHGETHTHNDHDLSVDTLVNDVSGVVEALWETPPPLVLVGHSMGGALAVRAAHHHKLFNVVRAIVVIDVVEGTAMESLASMQSFLRSRPTHFRSIENAIEWCVRSGQVRNVDSARVSMPSQIINCSTGCLATQELSGRAAAPADPPAPRPRGVDHTAIAEEEEDDAQQPEFQPPPPPLHTQLAEHKYTWRIELSRTEPHWAGWFAGLSAAFLSAPAARLLLLASIDGLDRELTVGQMQGKFQMQVLPRVGHAVHEDAPAEVARVISGFLVRQRLADATDVHADLVSTPGC